MHNPERYPDPLQPWWQRLVGAALAALLLVAPPLYAYPLDGLYEATVPASGEDEAARRKDFRTALAQVMVRVSADPAVIQTAESLLDEAATLVYRYEYRDQPPPGVERTVARWLRVKFHQQPLLEAMGRAGIATWGSERPLTLLWPATDIDGKREFVSQPHPLLTELLQHTRQLGLPAVLPLLDLEDHTHIEASDVWLGFSRALWTASMRYKPDAILTLCLESQSDETRWTLYLKDAAPQEWRTAGVARVDQGLSQLATTLADRFGRSLRVEDQESAVPIRVTRIRDFNHYLDVIDYLESLELTSRVTVRHVHTRGVVFYVHTYLGANAVRSAIALGERLQPLAGLGEDGTPWYQAR